MIVNEMHKADSVHIGYNYIRTHTDLLAELTHIAEVFLFGIFHAFQKVYAYQKTGNDNK